MLATCKHFAISGTISTSSNSKMTKGERHLSQNCIMDWITNAGRRRHQAHEWSKLL
jgi:hypothetical protein